MTMARITRAAFLTALSVANGPERPRWNAGDFFERRGGGRSASAP